MQRRCFVSHWGHPKNTSFSTCSAFFNVFKLLLLSFSFKFQIGFFYTSFNNFRNLHSRHKETLQLGPRGALGFLGPKVFFRLPNFSLEGFLETFSSFGTSLGFFHCKDLLSANTFWVVLFRIQGLAHFAIVMRFPPLKTWFNQPHS